jgi:hypothetical protein
MKLKLDEEGGAVLQDGKPVYVHDDGKEVAFDAPGTVATIARLNGEARTNRERYETAETGLKAFEGIDDPAVAREALKTVLNLDAKKLIDAGEADRVRREAVKATEAKYKPIVEERDAVKAQLENNILGGAFLRSKFIADKLAIPADLAEAKFRSSFKNENGNVVGYDANGNKILAPGRPGEVANFDEAMEVLVSNYSNRDQILKGSGASGSGAQGGGGQGGSKTISREAFAALAPAAQATTARDPNVTITD